MRKSNIGVFLSKLRPDGVLALMRNVVAKMTNNTHFAEPLVKLVDMVAKADALETAIEEATFGSRGSKLVRNQLVRESGVMLNAQAGYVRGVADGDAVILESSGFALARPVVPLPPPTAPVDFKVSRTTTAGELKLQWKSERGALLYYGEMQEEGSNTWMRIISSKRVKHTVKGLTTGKAYSFRVQVVGASGESPMSETVTQRAA